MTTPSLTPARQARLYLGPQCLLYVGPVTAERHRHQAAQYCIALEREFRLQRADPHWQLQHSALLAPDQPHALDGAGAPVAILLLDMDGSAYRRLANGPPSEQTPPWVQPELRQYYQQAATPEATRHLIRRLLDSLLPAQPAPALDPRVARVLAYIAAD